MINQSSVVLDRAIYKVRIGTMQLRNYLESMESGELIVVSKDRFDIIIGALVANYSKNYPAVAGVLLTEKMATPSEIDKIIEATGIPVIPILSTDRDTQSAIEMLQKVSPEIGLESIRKLALVEGIFIQHIDLNRIKMYLIADEPKGMNPIRFKYQLYNRARESKSNILLIESEDDRVLRAVDIALRRDLCKITLLGKKDKIEQKSGALGLDLSKAKVIDQTKPYTEQFINKFYELRRDKGGVEL